MNYNSFLYIGKFVYIMFTLDVIMYFSLQKVFIILSSDTTNTDHILVYLLYTKPHTNTEINDMKPLFCHNSELILISILQVFTT